MMGIKSIEVASRPREKAMVRGINCLSDEELLAIIIRCGTKERSAIELARELLSTFGGLSKLVNVSAYELMRVNGIKKAKAMEILASFEIVKRAKLAQNNKIMTIRSERDIYDLVKDDLLEETQEKFVVLFLNIRNHLLKKEIVFVGGESSSNVDVNLLFKRAISYGSKAIVCAHNHPSGDLKPSDEDILLTKKIKKIGEFLKIQLLDHIIIGKDEYVSLKGIGIV